MLPAITNTDNIPNITEKFLDIVWEVPFGNSDFQNKKVVVDWMQTPERAYRHAALRIQNRLAALWECETNLKKKDIERRRNLRKIERLEKDKPEDYDLDIELLEVEMRTEDAWVATTKKMVADAIIEVNSLLPIINSIWKLSKDDFEKWEALHFAEIHWALVQWKTDSIKMLETISQWEQDLFEKIVKWETHLKLN